ncbi:MAG: haloalkane dehalogenase [Nitrospirae bacterium]|nr:haloalkane dehalogenase [Nitrospirota bacterium]
MAVIKTPEERFYNLPDFSFKPHYAEVNGLRVHYVDEGKGEAILCLHGEPTWSYLYRKMIPILSAKHRVIAMDFIGFGRSDKFTEQSEYSFKMHCDILTGFINALSLKQITLVMQDWGGPIGLRLVSEMPERFARLVIMNTWLPTGDVPVSEAFLKWRHFVKNTPDLPIGQVIRMGMANGNLLTPEIMAAYEAPFPNASYKAGAAAWPLLVPIKPDDAGAAEMRQTREFLSKCEKPTLVMFSDKDPITSGADRLFRKLIPSAKGQPEITIKDASHFLQEEKGEEIAQHILKFMQRTI